MNDVLKNLNPGKPLKALLIEDDPVSAEVNVACLRTAVFNVKEKIVQTEEEFREALENGDWDLILSDFELPNFSGEQALAVFKQAKLDVPFIVISGKIGEEKAAELMRMGANDCVMKQNMARMIPVVRRELKEAENRKKRKAVAVALERTQERHRSFFENATLGIFCATIKGKILEANPALVEMLHYKSADELRERLYYMSDQLFVSLSERETFVQYLNGSNQKRLNMEARWLRGDGTVMIANVNAWFTHGEDGETIVEGMVEDLTEKKSMEEKMKMHELIMRSATNL